MKETKAEEKGRETEERKVNKRENGRREEEGGMDKRRICKRRIISAVYRIFQATRED